MPKKKRQPNKQERLEAARKQHEKFLRTLGIDAKPPRKLKGLKENLPNLKVDNDRVARTSDRVPGGVVENRDIFHDHKWKRDMNETEGTMQAIRNKAKDIAPAYNKGPLQYLPFNPADARKQ